MPQPIERVVIREPSPAPAAVLAVVAPAAGSPTPPEPEVRDQKSEVSNGPQPLTSDLRPLTSEPHPPELSPELQRDLCGVLDAVTCPVRQQILLALAAGGRAHVGGLAGRTGVSQKTLSHHLGHLRTAGLVFGQRSGKCIWYEAAPSRVC